MIIVADLKYMDNVSAQVKIERKIRNEETLLTIRELCKTTHCRTKVAVVNSL